MPFIEQLAQQTAGNAVGAGMGLLLQGINNKAQLKQQQKLTDQQVAAQKQMAMFNREQQMQLWNDTNYSAQKEQMKKAGLSPGLMYGTSGGGATTANASPGSVSAPQAGKNQESLGMGLQMGQAAMMAAQIDLLKAQTEKTKAEIPNVPLTGENIKATTGNIKADTEIKKITASIESSREEIIQKTQNAAIAQALTQLRSATAEMDMLERNNQISAATKQQQIDKIKADLAGTLAENSLKDSGTNLNKERIREIGESIRQKWSQIDINATDVQIKQKLQEFETDFGKQYGAFAAILVRLLHGGN